MAEELELNSRQAHIAMQRLGYVPKDLLQDGRNDVPSAFAIYMEEYRRIYQQETQKARKQRVQLFLQELEEVKNEERIKEDSVAQDSRKMSANDIKQRHAYHPHKNMYPTRVQRQFDQRIQKEREFERKEQELKQKLQTFTSNKQQILQKRKKQANENMNRHLKLNEEYNQEKVNRALQTINKIQQRLEQTQAKKEEIYKLKKQQRDQKESDRQANLQRIYLQGVELEKARKRQLQKALNLKNSKSQQMLQSLNKQRMQRSLQVQEKKLQKLCKIEVHTRQAQRQQEEAYKLLEKKDEQIDTARISAIKKIEIEMKDRKKRNIQRDMMIQSNIAENKRAQEQKCQQILSKINNFSNLKKESQDERERERIHKRILQYIRTIQNHKRFEIAKRKDYNQKLRGILKKEKIWNAGEYTPTKTAQGQHRSTDKWQQSEEKRQEHSCNSQQRQKGIQAKDQDNLRQGLSIGAEKQTEEPLRWNSPLQQASNQPSAMANLPLQSRLVKEEHQNSALKPTQQRDLLKIQAELAEIHNRLLGQYKAAKA